MSAFKFGDKVIYCGQVGIFWKEIPESVASAWILLGSGLEQVFLNDIKEQNQVFSRVLDSEGSTTIFLGRGVK